TSIVSESNDRSVRIWDAGRGLRISNIVEWNVSIRSNEGHTSSRTELQTLHTAMLNGSYPPIRFSPLPSHALHHGAADLCRLTHDTQDLQQCVRLCEDGWIRGHHGQLLLWVPLASRKPFYTMWTRLVIPSGSVELDLSRMAHGKKWKECFEP
ncbi:hypothetical protein V8B97DRAFT_1544161, partial [Scleroderma yunnanense]